MKKSLSILIVTTTFLAACLWWYQNFHSDQTEAQQPVIVQSGNAVVNQSNDEMETIEEQTVTDEAGETTEKGQAKTIVHVTESGPDSSQLNPEPESEFQQLVKQMVESSLAGTVEDSITLGRLMNQCGGVPRNEGQIKKNLKNMNKKFSRGKKLGLGNDQSRTFENFSEYEVYAQEKVDQCRVIRSIFKNDLHKQIARQAAKGNKIARYLYAMWPPSLGGRFRAGKMPEWLQYQNEALAYTWQNIDEGEPLGLLAFGQSFGNVGGGFFTPTNFRYAQAFFQAAKKCGLESQWVDGEIGKYIVDLGEDIDGLKLDRAEIRAEELKELFCQ